MTRLRKLFARAAVAAACGLPLAIPAVADAQVPVNAKVPASKRMTNKELHALLLKSSGWVRFAHRDGGTSNGTAWVIDLDRRLMITNDHVVADRDEVGVIMPKWKDGKLVREESAYDADQGIKAVVIDRDRTRDLALIQLESLPAGMVALPMAADEPEEGDMIRTIGGFTNGGDGLVWGGVGGEVRSVGSNGGLNRLGTVRTVLSTAPTNGGNSGGPVVNEAGEVVAVNSYGIERGPGGRQVNGVAGHVSVREVKDYYAIVTTLVTPKLAAEWTLRGERRMNAGRLDSAIRDFGEAIAKDSKHAAAYHLRGDAFTRKNDPQTGMEDLNKAIELDGSKYDFRITRGQARRALGKTEDALADFTAAIRNDPSKWAAYNERGITLFRSGKWDAAEEDFTRAIDRDANIAVFWSNRADCKLKRKEYDDAADDYEAAARKAPWNTQPIVGQADALAAGGKTQAAVEVLVAAAKRLNNATLWQRAGLTWLEKFEYKKALPLFASAIKAHDGRDTKELARMHVGRGICLREDKQYGPAIEELTKAIELDADNGYAYLHRGLSRQASGGDGKEDFAAAAKRGVENANKVAAAANPMVGHWRGVHYLNGVKVTHTIRFNADGTFHGSIQGGGRMIEDSGTWTHDGDRLTIRGRDSGTVVRKIALRGEDCDVGIDEIGQTVTFSKSK